MEALKANSGAFDLIVVGGGPAGTAAAVTAARSGRSVLLLERGQFPRQKVCGEFVSAESLALLMSLLPEGADGLLGRAPRIAQGRLFVDGRVIRTAIDPAAVSISRFDLDHALWQAALQAGVDARFQTSVQSLEGRGPFRVRTPAGSFEGRTALNATGRWSNLSRGGQPHDAEGQKWLGVKAHFAEAQPAASVDLYFFEGGYCGVQPAWLLSDGAAAGSARVNVCAMVRADVASSLEEVFAQSPALLERSHQWQPLMEAVSTSPLLFREPEPVREGVFRAGDASGFVDPFVGDGISLALRSGAAAAQHLVSFLRGEVTREEGESRYAEAYRRTLLPVFRNSARLRRLFRLPKVMRAPIAEVLEQVPSLATYLVRSTR
jgi:flavin-dependent dehydrogenase